VERAVDAELAGLECLSGIPGLVGGTPIQNVGAMDKRSRRASRAYATLDRVSGETRERTAAECGFAYRTSVFKGGARDEIVTAVTFALRRDGVPTLRYAELDRALRDGGATTTLRGVRDAVLALRRSKSMVIDHDDPNRRSAGSFFTNPIVSTAKADDVAARALAAGVIADVAHMPRFPCVAGDQALGRLARRARRLRQRDAARPVGVSSKHALALVHHGGGTTSALLDLALEIVHAVRDRFESRCAGAVIVADHPLARCA